MTRHGHVSVSGATRAALEKHAESRGVTIESVVESLVSDLPPSPWELAERDARGYAMIGRRGRVPGVCDDVLRRLHAEGLTDRAIAERIGITPRALGARMRRLGLPANGRTIRPRLEVPRGRTAVAVDAIRQGTSIADAARIADLDYSTAREAKRRWVDARGAA